MNRHNWPIQKSELGINRLYRPIQSEDRIGIGRSINRTFRPPLVLGHELNIFFKTCKLKSVSCIFALMVFKLSGFLFVKKIKYTKLLIVSVKTLIDFRHGTLLKRLVAAQKPAYLLYDT